MEARKTKLRIRAVNQADMVLELTNILLARKQIGERYYKIMDIISEPKYLIDCYNLIKGKPGNMTPGLDKQTLDGVTEDWFISLGESLKNGKFQFKPSRQVMIPKAKSVQLRPLAIGSPRDKIVQKALQLVLESIWEPQFLNSSHGFRPGRSVHSALLPIYLRGNNYSWVIQGDITKCFDKIPHSLIMEKISKQIGDPRYLELLSKFLNAGIKTSERSLIKPDLGTPQGGILSPILANIILHELDSYMDKTELKFRKGVTRKQHPAYSKIKHLRKKAILSRASISELKYLLKQQFQTTMVDYRDPNFRRLMYIRYADDFIILIEGTVNEAHMIKNNVKELLWSHCRLELNDSKTTISNLSDNKFKFLGAEIVKPIRGTLLSKIGNVRRRPHLKLLLKAPIFDLVQDLLKAGFIRRNPKGAYTPVAFTKITNLTHYEIVSFFNTKIRGIINFYSFASNYNRLRYILFLLQFSCAYTLARKLKLRPYTKVFKRFGKKLTCPDTEVGLEWPRTMKVLHDYKKKSFNLTKPSDLIKITWSNKITKSTFGKVCALCDSTSKIEMHHLRSVKDVRTKMRTGNSIYQQWIGATLRKQIPLCGYHHNLYHSGQLTPADLRVLSRFVY